MGTSTMEAIWRPQNPYRDPPVAEAWKTEIMALAALPGLEFNVVPIAEKWVKPTWENSPVQTRFPVLDKDIEVEFQPRDREREWRVTFSGSDEVMRIVSEDIIAAGEEKLCQREICAM
ncbi:hypothetical protein M434DRAFT_36844 [Hypoxylon sp. CO27-5]|nr:hypothetical protein M434DRAFT_36844 [Hypoxylon sp. CO27-5]